VTLPLHEEAVEDLRKSGLSDATIAAAGLYTPPPGDLPRLLSPRLVDKVRHVLVFPYDGASHGIPMRRPLDQACRHAAVAGSRGVVGVSPFAHGQECGHATPGSSRGRGPRMGYLPKGVRIAFALVASARLLWIGSGS